VIIIGRLDEYLAAKAEREKIAVPLPVIEQAGLAVTKKLNRIFAERGYRGMILTGGTRRRHIDQLAGARMCLTIGAAAQDELLADNPPRRPRDQEPVAADVIQTLRAAFPEFNQAYDEDGLAPDQFTEFPPCRVMHDWFIDAFNQIVAFARDAGGK
jgi:hypothetical protein